MLYVNNGYLGRMNDTYLIIVLYNPAEECKLYWRKKSDEIGNCIFVDNSSDPDKVFFGSFSDYIPLYENKGIAAAQNIGIKRAKDKNAVCVIFFDQDSNISKKLCLQLCNEFKDLNNHGKKVGAVGPSLINIETGKTYKGSDIIDGPPVETDTIISSGTITSLDVLDRVGFMNERLFIDLVDHEWCWRARSKGYAIYRSTQAVLKHHVGGKTNYLLGYPIIVSAPKRYYFQYRNTFWLAKTLLPPVMWKKRVAIRRLVEFVCVPFMSDKPFKTWLYMIKGIKCGISENL